MPLAAWEYGATGRRSYNRDLFSSDSYWYKSLEADTPLHPNSTNMIRNLCTQMSFDPDTDPAQLFPDSSGGPIGNSWMRFGDPFYIVDDTVTPVSMTNVGGNEWDDRFNAVVDELGGLPIPPDATAMNTADKYIFIYQPSTNLFAVMSYVYATDFATTTISCPGATSGTFQMVINYADNIMAVAENYTTAAIARNASNATIAAAVCAATNGTGQRLDRFTPELVDVLSGGPLPDTPVVLRYWIATPNRNIPVSIINSTVNGSGVVKAEHPSGPYQQCYHGAVIAPGHGFGGIDSFYGTYEDRIDAGFYWMDKRMGPAATSIEYMGGMGSYDEAVYADANGVSLEHALVMTVGNCQASSYVYPAIRSDGTLSDSNAIVEGARIRFPADIDLSYVEANFPEFLWVARTIRDKGVIVYDKTGGGCSLNFRQASFVLADGSIHGDGWSDLLVEYQSSAIAARTYMQALPWHLAQVVTPSFSVRAGGGGGGPASTGAYFGMRI